jgi:hypothetical protein
MSIETTNKKERRMHDFGLLEERVRFSSLLAAPFFPFSFSFYILGNPNPFSIT